MFGRIKSQKGQATLEMVLILALLVTMGYLVKKGLKDGKVVHRFVAGPWKTVNGMIESGSWAKRQDAMANHPNYFRRMYSQEGVNPN